MAPHALRSYFNTEDARRRRFPVSPPRLEDNYGIEFYGNPIGKEDFFRSMGLRMKRVRYDKFFEKEEVPPKKKKRDVPARIHLRECSVVIQGVMCRICGRDFKCSTDLATHMKSRHFIVGDSFGNDIYCDLSSETDTDASRIQDSSSPTPEGPKTRRKRGTKRLSRMRLVFKMGTEIVGDLFIKRKHLKRAVISKSKQTCESPNSEKNYEHVAQNASLFISQDESLPANVRTGPAIQTEVTDRVSIIETACKSVTQNDSAYTNSKIELVYNGPFPNQNIHRSHPYSITPYSACTITRVDNSTIPNNMSDPSKNPASVVSVNNAAKDEFSAENKFEVPTSNNSLPMHSIHRNLPRPMVTVTHSLTPVQTSPTTNTSSQAIFNNLSRTQMYNSSKNALENSAKGVFSTSNNLAISSRQISLQNNSSEFARDMLENGSTEIRPNVFVSPVLREQRSTFAGQPSLSANSTERLRYFASNEASPLTTIENLSLGTGYNTKPHETTKPGSDDDDIQEIVRISRGKIIPGPIEINHESPNRADREILQVVDAISDMIRMEAQGLHLLGDKENTDNTKVTRISSNVHMKNPQQENVPQIPFGDAKTPNIQRTEHLKVPSFQSETTKEQVPTTLYKSPSEAFQHYSFNYSSASPEIRCGNKMTPRCTRDSHTRPEPESKSNRAVILIDLVDD